MKNAGNIIGNNGGYTGASFVPGISSLRAMLVDIDGLPMELDSIASGRPTYGYQVFVEVEHHKIHEGAHFTKQLCDYEVDIASPKYVLLRAPDTATRIHQNMEVSASGAINIQLFEDPSLNSDGTPLVVYNNDRNSLLTPEMLLFEDPDVLSDGIDDIVTHCVGTPGIGAAFSIGGNSRRERELIFKQNTDYVVKVTPDANDTIVSICVEWYEVIR